MSTFEELALSVEEISMNYFRNEPSLDLATKITLRLAGLPTITGTTETSRAWRCLFVQHQIFSVLHTRVFRPFILTSSHDAEDDFGPEPSLAMISKMISSKSVRREAIWRAITTRAIYASEHGRKAAGVVATAVSVEVMEKLQSMATADALPDLLEAVRMVSKRAVELWRQVRVQCPVVRSIMPSIADNEKSDSPSAFILWIRPLVENEGSSHVADLEGFDGPETVGSIYLQGTAVSQDSPVVVARRQELRGNSGFKHGDA